MTDLTGKTVAELTTLYNTRAERPIKKFDSKPVAIERIRALCVEKKLTVVEKDGQLQLEEKASQKPAASNPRRASAGRPRASAAARGRTRYSDDMVIVVQREESPKRITKRNPYAVYRTGMKVADALKKGVKRRDINWDASPQRPDGPVIRVVTQEQFARLSEKNGATA